MSLRRDGHFVRCQAVDALDMVKAAVGIGQFIDPEPGTLEADSRFAAWCGEMARRLEAYN